MVWYSLSKRRKRDEFKAADATTKSQWLQGGMVAETVGPGKIHPGPTTGQGDRSPASACLVNHHDVAVQTEALLELLADVDHPQLKVGFDAWSPALRGEDLYEAARRIAPHVAITTNADYVRLPRFRYVHECVNYQPVQPDLVRAVPFGEGFIDYASFFQGLRDGGFDGVATYEMCSPIRGGGVEENLDRYARRYLDWMRTWSGQPEAHGL